ncbi:hypothetical protein AB834_01420 [PVC group bacterium (ex Bugula neritina AB1)]|nr:hypothetical protein AB834_01420 [PVC group bacterium (ex Bugula neritina AB1)]
MLTVFKQEIEALQYRGKKAERVEYKLPRFDILYWLKKQSNTWTKIYWKNRDDSFCLGAVGFSDEVCFDELTNKGNHLGFLRERLNEKYPHQRYIGGLPFDEKATKEKDFELWQGFLKARFVLPMFELTDSSRGFYFACNLWGKTLSSFENKKSEALTILSKIEWDLEAEQHESQEKYYQRFDYPESTEWCKNVQFAINKMSKSPLKKVVLARCSKFLFEKKIPGFDILDKLRAKAGTSYFFAFQFEENAVFLGASPERLYKRQGRSLETEALAGTRARGETKEEDSSLSRDLLNSSKDMKEHNYVLDHLLKVLSPFTDSLDVYEKMGLMKLPYSQHLFSKIKGILQEKVSDDQLLQMLHPTPAVGGIPTDLAIETINQCEERQRGWYSAPVGWVSLDQVEFSVAIRSALVKNKEAYLFSGGGVLKESSSKEEWDEIENKISHFLNLFS